MKKITTIILSAVIAFSAVPVYAAAPGEGTYSGTSESSADYGTASAVSALRAGYAQPYLKYGPASVTGIPSSSGTGLGSAALPGTDAAEENQMRVASTVGSSSSKKTLSSSATKIKKTGKRTASTVKSSGTLTTSYVLNKAKKYKSYTLVWTYKCPSIITFDNIPSGAVKAVSRAMDKGTAVNLSKYKIPERRARQFFWAVRMLDKYERYPLVIVHNGYITYAAQSNFSWSPALARSKRKADIVSTNDAVEEASAIEDEKSRYEFINDYIKDRAVYDEDNEPDCYFSYGALVSGRAVCEGYAIAFCRIAYYSGLRVNFRASDWPCHGWNEAYVDGAWKTVDVTWNDDTEEDQYLFTSRRKVHKVSRKSQLDDYDWTYIPEKSYKSKDPQ
jgi:hypothetical protein